MGEQVAEIGRGMDAPWVDVDPEPFEKPVALVRQTTRAGWQDVIIEPPRPGRKAARPGPFNQRIRELMAPFVAAGSMTVMDLVDALGDGQYADLAQPSQDSQGGWATLVVEKPTS